MDPYVLAFYLELGIGVIRPAFDISILSLFGRHIDFFGLLLNREIALIALLNIKGILWIMKIEAI